MFLFLYFSIPFVFLKCLCSSNVNWLRLHLRISSNNNIPKKKKKKTFPESYYKPFLEHQKIIAIAN